MARVTRTLKGAQRCRHFCDKCFVENLPNDFDLFFGPDWSGTMSGGRLTCENCPSIDVRQWSRLGKLWPTKGFEESWTVGDQPAGSVSVANEPNEIVLGFMYYDGAASEWKSVSSRLKVVWSRCTFGGGRPWLLCPLQTCGKRIAVAYLGRSPVFACRKCHDLAYATQFEPAGRRGIERARGIRMKLGGGPNLMDEFPGRPKGMHNRTYLRHKAAYAVAAARCGAAL
jgi:hypothetical protein